MSLPTAGSDPLIASSANVATIVNALTVDVEDYFQVEAFRSVVGHEKWDNYRLRVEDNTYRILDLFDQLGVKATFFTLGWIAHKKPRLIEELVKRGHEVGCHSYWHRLIYSLKKDEFRDDTERATRYLEDATGKPVRLYRAPTYSVVPRSAWALEILADLGYEVDSSIFPIRHDYYGFRSFPRFPVRTLLPGGKQIVEFPMSTMRIGGANFPGAGGGYLRILPLAYSLRVLRRLNYRERRPGVVYFHPWEVDPDQLRLQARWRSKIRHYTGLKKMEAKLRILLKKFSFAPMTEVLNRYPPRDEVSMEDLLKEQP